MSRRGWAIFDIVMAAAGAVFVAGAAVAAAVDPQGAQRQFDAMGITGAAFAAVSTICIVAGGALAARAIRDLRRLP